MGECNRNAIKNDCMGIIPRIFDGKKAPREGARQPGDSGQMEKKDMNNGGKAHYCLLYTQILKQWKVSETFQRTLPEGKGDVLSL